VANRLFYTLIAFTSPQKNNIGDLAKCEKNLKMREKNENRHPVI